MTGNRSLDEFLPAGDDGEVDDCGEVDEVVETVEGDDRTADPDADEPIEPAASTYAWSPDGAPCEVCGAVVEERWRDGDELVCAECKAW